MSDWGQMADSLADAATGIALAAVSLIVSNQYVDLADNYETLYEDQRLFYYNNFQANGELPFNSELFMVPFYVPLYSGATSASSLYYFNPELAAVKANWQPSFQRHLQMFNVENLNPLVPSAADLAGIIDDWDSYYFRYEEHRRDVYNARRFAQQMDSLSYGVKEGAMVERGLASSFAVFDEASGQLSSFVSSVGNGLSTYVGQQKGYNDIMQAPKAIQDDAIFHSNFEAAK